MLAFFNMVAAKIIPVICVLFALGAGQAVRTVSHAVSPVVSIFAQSETRGMIPPHPGRKPRLRRIRSDRPLRNSPPGTKSRR